MIIMILWLKVRKRHFQNPANIKNTILSIIGVHAGQELQFLTPITINRDDLDCNGNIPNKLSIASNEEFTL